MYSVATEAVAHCHWPRPLPVSSNAPPLPTIKHSASAPVRTVCMDIKLYYVVYVLITVLIRSFAHFSSCAIFALSISRASSVTHEVLKHAAVALALGIPWQRGLDVWRAATDDRGSTDTLSMRLP